MLKIRMVRASVRTRRPDGRAGQLVEGDEPGLEPGVGHREIVAADQHRRQGGGGVVGEDLGGGEQSQGQQRDGYRDPAGDHRGDENAQYHCPDTVRGDHDPPPVEPVRQHPGVQAEHQRRRPSQPAPSRAGTRSSTILLTRTGPYVCRRPSRTPIFVTGSGTPSGDVVHLLNDIHALQTRAHPQRNRSERLHRVRRLCGCRDPLLSFDPRA